MLNSKYIEQNNESYLEFLGRTSMAFGGTSPSTHYGEQNIAIYKNEEMVAGVTLVPYRNILIDSSLTKYFDINRALPAVKMTRLWRTPTKKNDTLIELFKTTYQHIDQNCYLYGILELPYNFVQKRQEFFSHHLNLVAPINHYSLFEEKLTTSPMASGQGLLNLYLKFGAELLGAPAGCSKDNLVRVVLGMPANEINMDDFLKRIL